MRRPLRTLALLACLAIGVAATNATHPLDTPTVLKDDGQQTPRATPARTPASASGGEAVRVASAYALAATNWTAHGRLSAWRSELELAAPAHRRALQAARPTGAQLRALRADAARSRASVTWAELDGRVSGERARVVVWLTERTSTRAGVLTGETRNQVRLERHDGRWQVSAWTAAPDAGAR